MIACLRRALVLTMAVGAALTSMPTPLASAAPRPPVINVTAGAHGFQVSGPARRHAGRVTLHFTSTNPANDRGPGGSDVEMFKLGRGVTVAKVISTVRADGPSDGPPTRAHLARAAAATRFLNRNVRFFGGAAFEGRGAADVTETLFSGTYYLMDINAVFAHQPVTVRSLRIFGTPPARDAAAPSTPAVLRTTSTDRFQTPTVLPAGRSYLIRNTADTIHFVLFSPVRRGTTDADISKALAAIAQGREPVDLADHSRLGVQSGVLSPGNQVVFSSPLLTRGTYDLECFISDDRTGMPHFFMGMHKIVVVR